jgi:hypothetical protein
MILSEKVSGDIYTQTDERAISRLCQVLALEINESRIQFA